MTTYFRVGVLSRILFAALAAAILTLAARPAAADTYSWSGLSTASWADSGSWFDINSSLNGVPGGGDIALFGGSSYTNLPALPSAQTVGGVWDNGTGAATISVSTTSSQTLTINGTTINGNANTGIEMDAGAGTLAISSALTLGGAQTWLNNSSSPLTVSSAINNNGNLLTYGGIGNASFGAISGSGGLTMNGGGVLTLNTRGTYTGNVVISGGTVTTGTGNNGNSTTMGENTSSARTVTVNQGGVLSFTTNNIFYGGGQTAAGLPTVVINGGLVTSSRYNVIGNVNLSGGTLNQNATDGTGTAGYQGYDILGAINVSGTAASYITNLNISGANTLGALDHLASGGNTFNVGLTGASGGDLIVSAGLMNGSGDYPGTGSVTKTGLGNMVLQSTLNSYTGTTTVSAGTMTFAAANVGNGTVPGSVINVGPAGVLALNSNDATGYSISLALTVSGVMDKLNAQSETLFRPITLSGGTMTSTTVGAGSGVTGAGAWNFFGNFIATAPGTSNFITGVGQFSLRTATCYFTTGANSSLTISVPISEDGGSTAPLLAQGSGTLILTASNYYTAATTISGGTLMLGNGQSGQDGSINSTSGVTDNSNLAFNIFGSQTVSPAISGTGRVAMIGSGIVNLSKANRYLGGTSISNGTLQLGNAAALSSGTIGVNGGVLDINGLTPSTAAITLFSGSIINSGGTGSLNNVAFNNYNTRSGTVSAVLGGAAGLNQNTAGLTLLTAANTYTGPTTVSAGTLMLGPAGTLGSGNTTIVPGALLDTSSYGPAGYNFNSGVLAAGRTVTPGTDINGSLNVNNATLSPAGVGTVGTMTTNGNLSLNGATVAYDQGDLVAAGGALSFAGTDYIVPNASLTAGTYTLFTFGSLGSGTSGLAMGGASGTNNPRQSFSLGLAGNSITLTVTGTAGNLQWSGGSNSTWDTGVSQNWLNLSYGTADKFYTGDNVTFNDTPGTATTVTISGAVQPGSVTVSNTNASYTISGSGSIAGTTSLVMNGPGALTIATSNSYSGVTYLNGGTLNANAGSALGVGPLTISGGTLDNTSGAAVTLNNSAQNWNSSFTFLGSNPLNMGTGPVTLGTSPTLYVSASTLTVGGVISGVGALTKNGPGTLVLGGNNTYFGGTSLLNGTIAFAAGGLGSTGPIALSGGTTLQYLSGNTQDISSRLSLTGGSSTINLNSNSVAYASAITGSGGLIETGGGNLLVSGANTFSGGVFINSGSLTINGAGGGAGPFANSTITVAAGAVLALNVSDSLGYSDTSAVTIYGTLVKTVSQSETMGRPFILSGGTMTSTGTFPATNGAWDFFGANDTISTVPGTANYIAGTGGFSLRTATCFFNTGANSTLTISVPVIQNTNSTATPLNLEGSGLLLLTGSSTYTGVTNIAGGTLEIGGAGVLSAGNYGLAIGNSGALVFNTSTNQTLSGKISGTGTLTQAGPSTLTLTASNTYSGGTTISNGTLNVATIVPVAGASNIGNATTAIALGNSFGAAGTLNYTGSSATFAPGLALNAGGGNVIVANAGQTLTFGGASGSGPLSVGGAGNASFSGAITGGSVSLTAATGGIVTLAANNTFGEGTTVSPGSTLYLNGANATSSITVGNLSTQAGATLGGTGSASSAVVNVADGSTVDFSQNTGSTFAVAALNFANQTNGITLNLNDAGGQYSNKPAISAGTVSTGFGPSPINVNIANVPTGSGTMEILQYASGSINESNGYPFYLNSPTAQGRAVYNLTTTAANGLNYLDLSYSVDYLHWTGAVNLANGWDTTTPNWVLNSTGGTTTYQDNTDIVVFDDVAGPNGTVNMASVLYPANVTFSNTATSYVLQGPGGIQGPTAVTINGAGSVTIATSQNSYTGGTFVTSGTLNANSVSALGAGAVSVSGGVLNDGANGSLGTGPLAVSGGVANLVNPQTIASVTLSGGLLNVVNDAALGSGTLAISGGTLDNASGGPMTFSTNNPPLALNGSFTFKGSNPLNTGTGSVSILGGPTLNVSASTLTVAGPITGAGGLTKAGNGTLALLGPNSYTGTTAVTGGNLVGSTTTLPGPISLANNSNVTFNQTVNGTWGQTISGNGNVTVTGGATLLLGASQSYSGATVIMPGSTLQLPASGAIGIKFATSQNGPYPVTGTAGVVPIGNWNNLTGYTGATTQPLNDYNGNVTAVNVTWTGGADAYSSFGTSQTDPNGQLMNSYIDTSSGLPTSTVTITGIPYNVPYSMYVYFGSDGLGRTGSVSVSGGTATYDYATDSNVTYTAGAYPFIQTTDTSGANPSANYCVFTNLSGGSQQVQQDRGSNNNGIMAVEIFVGQSSQLLPAASPIVLASGGTLDMGGCNQTVASLADLVPGAGGSTVTTSLGGFDTLTLSPTGGSALYSGTIQNGNGRLSLVLNGPGLQILSGSNTYSGGTTISAGTLQLGTGSPGADGSLSTSAVTDNGALVYNLAGSQTASYVVSGSGSLAKVGSGVLVLGSGGGYSGPTTVGGGKLYLSGANATQSVLVAGGATLGGNASAPSAAVTVADTGVLEAGSGGLGSLTLGGLTFNNTSQVNIFNPYQYRSGAAIVTTASNGLTVNGGTGSVVLNLSGAAPGGSGLIQLMQYSGSIQGPNGFAAFGLNTSGLSGRAGTYALTSVPGYIDLSYNVDYPIWSGSVSNVWDTNTTPNWVLAMAGTATTFQVNDAVVFNDSAGTNNVVNISSGNVTPGSVTFSNSNVAYTLEGSFGIVGLAPLTVNGGGNVTITNSNGYTGGTSVSNGSTLNLNAAQAIGTGPLTVSGGTVYANTPQSPSSIALGGGVLSFAGSTLGSASVAFSGGTLQWQAGNSQDISSQINVANPGQIAYLNPNGNNVPFGSTISGAGGLEQVGGGTLTLNAATTYTGGTTVNSGVLAINNSLNNGTGMLLGTLTINAGGLVEIGAHDVFGYSSSAVALSTININGGTLDRFAPASTNETLTGVVVNMTGGLWSTSDGGHFDMFYNGYGSANDAVNVLPSNSTAIISANLNFRSVNPLFTVGSGTTASGVDLLMSGILTGGFGFTKAGPGVMVLTATANGAGIPTSTSSFTGNITINGGTVVAAADSQTIGTNGVLGAASNTRTITVNSGGVLQFDVPNVFGQFNATTAPTLIINGGVVTNAEPGAPFPAGLINNALYNIDLSSGTLTATTGQHGGYAAWNVNGAVTSSGSSLISTSDPIYGVMLDNAGTAPFNTTFNVQSGTLTITAPLVQDSVDGNISGLIETGAGTLILSGSNTYSGGTDVAAGTLIAASPHALVEGSSLIVGQGAGGLFAPAAAGPAIAATSGGAAAVPEPGTFALLAAGLLAGLFFAGRKRQ